MVGCLGTFALVAVVPTAHAETGAVVRITEFSHTGKVARLGTPGDGEYVELTNTGDAPADLTGWTVDNKAADPATGLSLTSLGTVAPGESVLVTDLAAADFRLEWGLKDSVKVLSNGGTHTLSHGGPDAIHLYDAGGTEIDAVSYGEGYLPDRGRAVFVDADHLGTKADLQVDVEDTGWWRASFADPSGGSAADGEGSWSSGLGSIGSPGISTHGTGTVEDIRDDSRPETSCNPESLATTPNGRGVENPMPWDWEGGVPRTVDAECAWVTDGSGQNLSGLAFDPNDADVLYAVKDTGHLYRLLRSGSTWARDTANGWAAGKALRFPGGVGVPDTEGLTVGADGKLYVTTERDYSEPGVPLASVLRFDPTSAATTLVATDQWVLTPDLVFTDGDDEDELDDDGVYVEADMGLDGVTFVPDSFFTSNFFRTDAGTFYDPADYPSKASPGLFLVAVEQTGHLLAYALNADHTYTRVGTILTRFNHVQDIAYDPALDRVWVHADNAGANKTVLMKVAVDGYFVYDRYYYRPADLPNFSFEGFAVAPAATAHDGAREVLWADHDNRFGHSLWSGTVTTDLQLAPGFTPLPIINGLPIIGAGALTAQTGYWGPGVTIHYRWLVDSGVLGEDGTVVGADAPLSLADPALAGKMVVLAVTGSRSGFRDATVTASVGISGGSLTTHLPRITGLVAVGRTLTAAGAAWGPAGVAIRYQWLADDRPIGGATARTFRLTRSSLGKRISVRLTGTKVGFDAESEESVPTARVRPGSIATKRPWIDGRAKAGQRLVARPGGTWRADGTRVRYRYQWFVDGHAVRGATRAGFEVTRAFGGKRIKVRVTGRALGYATVSRDSAVTARVTR